MFKLGLLTLLGAFASLLGLSVMLGWLSAMIWNHFPFLEAAHHMSLWDGFLLHLLTGLLFKSNTPNMSSN